MSQADVVFKAMKDGKKYSPTELAEITHINKNQVSKILKMLTSGMLIEEVSHHRYATRRKYKTKQQSLTF